MDKIDEILSDIKRAVETNDPGNGLGKLDWDELTLDEQKKFREKFELGDGGGEDTFTITYMDREFTIQIYNYKL